MARRAKMGAGADPKGRLTSSQRQAGSVSAPGEGALQEPATGAGDVPASLFGQAGAPEDLGPDYGRRRRGPGGRGDVSVYDEQERARSQMDVRGRHAVGIAVALACALVAALLLPQEFFGTLKTPTIAGLLSGIQTNVSGLLSYATGIAPYDPMRFKLYRYLIVAVAGAALGISGGVYQGALKNALASPTTLGVISGGTLGSALFVIFSTPDQAQTVVQSGSEMVAYYEGLSPLEHLAVVYGQAGCTLLGCFAVVAFVVGMSALAGHGRLSGIVLIVTGQVVGIVVNAAMALVRTYFVSTGDAVKSAALQQVRSGSFSALYTELDLLLMGVPVLAGVTVVVVMRLRLNALTFSDEEARSLGLSPASTRMVMVGACTLMTALVIAFCGSIGFVGFVVPHLTRRIVGPDFRYYIPVTALVGALFLVLAVFASSFFSWEQFGGTRLLTSLIGGVAFIVVALRGRNRTTADGF